MDQCFKLVNLDKREYVCPSCMSQGTSLAYWAIGPHSGIIALLLCNPDLGRTETNESPLYVITGMDRPVVIAEVSHKSLVKDQLQAPSQTTSMIGRWAGDRVCMTDEDDLNLQDDFANYTNITEQLVGGWIDYIRGGDAPLEFTYCGCSSFNSDRTIQP